MTNSTALAVEASGLVKTFGATVAVDGIDVSIPAGSVYGFLGPNGAGKTTTIRMLATLLRPDAGTARVFGYDVVRHAAAVRDRYRRRGATLGRCRDGRLTPAFALARASASRRHGPRNAR